MRTPRVCPPVIALSLVLTACAPAGPEVQGGRRVGDDTVVTWDNPDFVERGVTVTQATTKWNGVMERVITVGPQGVSVSHGDFFVDTSQGDGPATPAGLSVFGSVRDEELPARPDQLGTYSSNQPNPVVDLMAHGLRVGYTPLAARLYRIEPNGSRPDPFSTLRLRLDSSVALVPVQAVVVYHQKDAQGHFDGNTQPQRRPAQLLFWDHWPDIETARQTDGQYGETTLTQHVMPWLRRDPGGRYNVHTQMAPDAVWHRCGVQFRLVNYFEMEVPTRNVNPLVGNDEADPNRFWPKGTFDGAPLQDNLARARKHPRYMEGPITVIFMGRVGFPDAPEVGRALQGQGAIGVSLVDGRGTAGVVGHELGHLSGMTDVEEPGKDSTGKPLWDVMVSPGPGTEPTDNECKNMKAWADRRINFWMEPRTNPHP